MLHSVDKLGLSAQPLKASQAWSLKLEQQEQEAAKLRQAAQMFEAQFVKMLMGEMRKTVANNSLTSGGFGEEMFTSSLDEARADLVVQGRGIGISAMLEQQLGRGGYNNRPVQFRMNSGGNNIAGGNSAQNVYSDQASARSAYVAGVPGPARDDGNHAQSSDIKHEQLKSASHSPVMAMFNDMKNSRVAIEDEPAPISGHTMAWPLESEVSSAFGMRFHPILKTNRFHSGMDIKAPTGTSIQAAAEGRVIFAGNRGLLGKAVIIEHEDGRQTVYGHCSRLMVKTGQLVEQGDIIGKVGSTGRTTGPHLHFEVRDEQGRATDPMLSLAPKTAPEFMLAKGN